MTKIAILGFAHGHVMSYCGKWQSEDMGVEVVCGWDHDAERLAEKSDALNIVAADSAESAISAADAVVIASDDDRVELLAADGTRYRVDRDTLLAGWYGRFELLWQPPGAPLLIPGERSAAVTWLRTRLDDASSTATDPTLFDSDLGERVLAFQQAHDLTPDGLVGQQTMLKLDLLAGPGPRLTRAPD